MQIDTPVNDPVLEIRMEALINKAKQTSPNGSGVLVSPRMFKRLQDGKLLRKETVFGDWNLAILNAVTDKTIYIWWAYLDDEDYLFPPCVTQRAPNA